MSSALSRFSDAELREMYRRKISNQERSFQEFNEGRLVLESRPSKAIVELTQNCNFRCKMCLQVADPKFERYTPEYNMKMEVFEKVAESIFPHAYFVDLRGFGETVILPYWPEVVDRLEDFPLINWHLVTNLSLPRDHVWEKMMRCGFMLGFSCDGATKEVFEGIRIRSHFDKILHNLEVVSDSIKKYGRGQIYFITTVQRQNIQELPAIIELARKYSVPEVQFKIVTGFYSMHRIYHDEWLRTTDRKELSRSVDRALDMAVEYGVRVTLNDHELGWGVDLEKIKRAACVKYPKPVLNFPPPPELDPEFASQHPWVKIDSLVQETAQVSVHQRCFKPFHYTYVSSDGKVGTCNHMMNPGMLEMGDLNTQSFEEIWNGKRYQLFRKDLLNAVPKDGRCKWCFEHRLED